MKQFLLIILISIACVQVKAQDYTGYTSCLEQDSLALVAFYNATGGANWYSNQDGFSSDNLGDDVATYYSTDYPNAGMNPWLDGPVKDWFGVTLEKQLAPNGTDSIWRVIHLHPTVDRRSSGDDNLSGYVPREVGMLTALEWFKVNGNTGLEKTELPAEIYQPNMVEFDVEAAYFSGVVSDDLQNCPQLEFLNLRYNYFDSIPLINFIEDDNFKDNFTNSGNVRMFFYNNQLTWSTLEPTAEYLVANDGVYEARNQSDVGRAQEVVVNEGDDVTLTCTDAGSDEYATYTWYKGSRSTYKHGTTYTISGVTADDTASYKVKVVNSFVQENDANSDYSATYTKNIHLTFVPEVPTFTKGISTQDGKSVVLHFSKPMKTPTDSQKDEFTVACGGETKTIESISRTGRLFDRISLNLEGSLKQGEEVTVTYTKGSIVCSNGGELESFSSIVENRTSVQPNLIAAETRTDGMGVILSFDYFIDVDKLDVSDFSISGSDGNSVASVSLVDGEVDDDISKKLLLTVSNELSSTDVLTVSLSQEAVFALYGAGCDAVSDFEVTNNVEDNKVSVVFTVIDGTAQLDSISIYGDISTDFIGLFDDGTNGDETANDHIWSKKIGVAEGDFSWDAYGVTTSYEEVTKESTIDGVNYYYNTIDTVYNDSILSANSTLSLTVASGEITGDTLFGYLNNSLTLILDLKDFMAVYDTASVDPYVMGIDDDWTEGLTMSATDNQYQYTVTINQLAYDTEVQYSYRNGNFWENTNLLLRSAIVEGDTTITNSFGDFYASDDDDSDSSESSIIIKSDDDATNNDDDASVINISIYPNPVANYLNVSGMEDSMHVNIYDLTGTLVLTHSGNTNSINVSDLPKGIYVVRLYDQNESIYTTQIIKN